MKKFVVKTLLLSLPIVILAISIEYLLQQIPNDYSYKKNYLDKYADKIQILISGSSETYFGINPVHISHNAFNASHVSQSLDYDLAIYNKYQNNLNDLKVIVLPISVSTFWSKLAEGGESFRVKNYVIYYGMDANSINNYSELLSNELMYNFGRLYNYYILKKDDMTCTELGWGATYKSEEALDLYETGKIAATRHNKDIFAENRIRIFEENMKVLNLFLELLNKKDIKLIFLTTPAYYTYRENLNSVQLNKMVETINNFVKQFSNCYYFNWFEDTDFEATDFYDGDHMNEIGAEKLSKKLSSAIDSLGIF